MENLISGPRFLTTCSFTQVALQITFNLHIQIVQCITALR